MKTPIFLSFLEKLFLLNPSTSTLHLPFFFSTHPIVDLINKIKFNSLHALKLLLQDKNEDEEIWKMREEGGREEERCKRREEEGGRQEEEEWKEEEKGRTGGRREKEEKRGEEEEESRKEERVVGVEEEMLVEVGKRMVRGIVGQLRMLFGEEKWVKSFDSLMEMDSVREVVNEATDFLGERAGDYRFFGCFVDDELRFTYVKK